MNEQILENLKICTRKKWLWNYLPPQIEQQNRDHAISLPREFSNEVYQLTKNNLTKILPLKNKLDKQKILIVETEPLKFLAAFIAGVIAEIDIFLGDPAWQYNEWEQVLNLVVPNLVFGISQTKDLIDKVQTSLNNSTSNSISNFTAQESDLPNQCLIMIPTGGTSGKIRFAMHSWTTLIASVAGFQNYFACKKINSFCTLPLYHVSGLMQFVRSFVSHGNLVICPYQIAKILPIDSIAQQIDQTDRQEYFISLVPTQLQFLLDSAPRWLAQFKTVLLGGAPPMRSLLDLARIYNIPVAITYGMTETASGVVILKPQDFLAGKNSSGRVLPHAQVTINLENSQASDNNNKIGKTVKIGSIQINSESLCLGYYPQVFTQEFITDDLGYFDRDNYLHLIGRNSQKIITGGENVFPPEVEAAIWATGLVKDVCVLGIFDAKWGQAVTAIYVPVGFDTDLNLIKQGIKFQLAKYKQPKSWIQVDQLPRNNRGKVNYEKIKAIAENVKN